MIRSFAKETSLTRSLRSGTTLFSILVCLVAVTVIVIGSLAQSLRLHRQSRNQRLLEQTRWVLDAGISRAVSAINADPAYQGETIILKSPLRDYKPRLAITVNRAVPNQALVVDVVATMDPLEQPTVAVPFQRSLRFQFVPSSPTSTNPSSN